MCSDEQNENVQMPEMMEPQKVLVMVPRDSPSRPAIAPNAGNVPGVMPGQAPGESKTPDVILEFVSRVPKQRIREMQMKSTPCHLHCISHFPDELG